MDCDSIIRGFKPRHSPMKYLTFLIILKSIKFIQYQLRLIIFYELVDMFYINQFIKNNHNFKQQMSLKFQLGILKEAKPLSQIQLFALMFLS